MQSHQQIRELLDRVRRRWRRLLILRATVRAGLAVSGVVVALAALAALASSQPMLLAALAAATLVLVGAAFSWGFWPLRRKPTDLQVARFIEESDPGLDDRLVSAVDVLSARRDGELSGLAGPMVADAARRASTVDPSSVLSSGTVRRVGGQAAATLLILATILFLSRGTARRSYDSLALTFFPSRVTLEVKPGHARIQPGSALTIEARLVGNQAPVVARVLRADSSESVDGDEGWRAVDMTVEPGGTFKLPIESIASSFKYRVAAGLVTSPVYEVTVARAPRVTRIDAEYLYPPSFGMKPRLEEDGGDIYAPAGTEVRLSVHIDREASNGLIDLGSGKTIALAGDGGKVLTGSMTVVQDGSYRVALSDRDGMKNPGDTEYFIRTLEDRPPEVRILRPASDRTVTKLEEVDVEAQAEDDFGIDRFELVYAVRGSAEKVVALRVPPRSASATDSATIYLEDLNVQPGDFVSYYVRARDLARGKRASEARSDIFFLEVKPFEQEFELAQSQAAGGGGGNRQLDDLASAQKEIIVATWKLDRRAQAASGAKSEQDIKSVAKAESELKTRVEEASSAFRTSMMRDPRGRSPLPGRGGSPPPVSPRAGQTMREEDAMTAAAMAMGKAVNALNGLKTSVALPTEMEALNHLLRAEADVKKRQVSRQQAGAGGGGNRSGQDMSSLFDRELQRQQQTNYETPTSAEKRQDANADLLDKIKELARRQDELLKRQRDVARERERLTPEELKRELEKLTREQSELRQRTEDLAQQMGQQQGGQQQGQQSSSGQSPGKQQGRGAQSPQPGQSGQSGSQGQSAQNPAQAPQGGARNGQQMREASEEMRNAAGDLRRQDPRQASERGERALQRLRDIERQLESSSAPDEGRRARGDLQLEARQLADAQRQLESDLNRSGQGEAGNDTLRRLAGEQDRLAGRARILQQGLGRQAASPDSQGRNDRDAHQAVTQASREFGDQRVGERMRQSAEQMRAAAGQPASADTKADRRATAATQREVARALDKIADRLAAAEGSGDDESRKLSDQLGRAQELRERLDELTRELERLGDRGGQRSESATPQGQPGRGAQNPGPGAAEGGATLDQLRAEYNRKLQETRQLLDQLRRDEGTSAHSGPGFTFEGQGMVLSAPGTESFKQDFAKWEALRQQATQALELAESSLSRRLQAKAARDRLAAGVDDKPPAGYQQQVDSYFKALATKPKP